MKDGERSDMGSGRGMDGLLGLLMASKMAGQGDAGAELLDAILGASCDDPNCAIHGGNGKNKSPHVVKVPKASNHIFADAELVGARAQTEYLQETVSQLVETKTNLTKELKALEERHEFDEQRIESLRRQRNEQESRISNLTGINSRQERMLKENAEKLTGARQKAHDRQTVIDKIMTAIGNVPDKKPTKADFLECFAKIQEIVTAPPQTPAPAEEQTAP